MHLKNVNKENNTKPFTTHNVAYFVTLIFTGSHTSLDVPGRACALEVVPLGSAVTQISLAETLGPKDTKQGDM